MITRFEQAIQSAETPSSDSPLDRHGARVAGAILRAARLEYLASPRRQRVGASWMNEKNPEINEQSDRRPQPADLAPSDAVAALGHG